MSHFATIQTQIRDIAALRDACRELGVELIENTQAGMIPDQTPSRLRWQCGSFAGVAVKRVTCVVCHATSIRSRMPLTPRSQSSI